MAAGCPFEPERLGLLTRKAAPAATGHSANEKEALVILKIDRLAVELPAPTEPDPNGAVAVQELLGGRFGEMST